MAGRKADRVFKKARGETMKLLEISTVARRLAVSESTIRRMLTDPFNPLKGVRVHRGAIRVLEHSIEDLIQLRSLEKAFHE